MSNEDRDHREMVIEHFTKALMPLLTLAREDDMAGMTVEEKVGEIFKVKDGRSTVQIVVDMMAPRISVRVDVVTEEGRRTILEYLRDGPACTVSPAAAPSMNNHKPSIGISATGRATSCSSAPSTATS